MYMKLDNKAKKNDSSFKGIIHTIKLINRTTLIVIAEILKSLVLSITQEYFYQVYIRYNYFLLRT